MLVRRHVHSVAATADHHPEIRVTRSHGLCNRMRRIRIVHALGTVRTEVPYMDPLPAEVLDQMLLQGMSCMIAAYGYPHDTGTCLQRYPSRNLFTIGSWITVNDRG